MSNSKMIQNKELKVFLMVYADHEISFMVNSSMSINSNNCNKIAITKWLLNEFKQLKEEYDYLICSPYKDDNKGEYRTSIYSRLGFILLEDGTMKWTK